MGNAVGQHTTLLTSNKQTQLLIHELLHLCQAVIYVLILIQNICLPVTSRNTHFPPILNAFCNPASSPSYYLYYQTVNKRHLIAISTCLNSDLILCIFHPHPALRPLGLHICIIKKSFLQAALMLGLEV